MDILGGIILESFRLFEAMAFYLLLGFLFAGIIKLIFPEEKVAFHLGTGRFSSSLKATLFGIPLPICSCGVLPAAISLKRQGASKGATLSFLISTPVTGVDSIFATYALLGGLFTFFRVITSFFIAVLCGAAANLLLKEPIHRSNPQNLTCVVCRGKGSHSHSTFSKIRFVFKYAFGDLLKDISKWLVIGILIGGIISFLVPDFFISRYLGKDWISMFVMLVVGIPIYVCATGSIPIAAALMLKGMSPGAALVFLITGPATNTVSMTIIAKELGKKSLGIYLFFICTISILAGFILNIMWGNEILYSRLQTSEFVPEGVKLMSAVFLGVLMCFSTFKNITAKITSSFIKQTITAKNSNVKDSKFDCVHCGGNIKKHLKEVGVDVDKK